MSGSEVTATNAAPAAIVASAGFSRPLTAFSCGGA